MKKLFVTTLLVAFAFVNMLAQGSMSGSGTESDPYKIFYADQLNQVRNFCNQSGVYFKLMNDIDLTDWLKGNNPGEGWEPIGTSSEPFKGVFNGNGKMLTGFYINRTSTNFVGFFGYLSGATVRNLTIIGSSVKGNQNTGAFVGKAEGSTLSGLIFQGDVIGGKFVGGIIGYLNSGSINNVNVIGDVTSTNGYCGGVVGNINVNSSSESTINGAFMQGNVTNTGSGNYTGGIAGYANSINNSTFSGIITSQSSYTGGIAGYFFGGMNNKASGKVTGKEYTAGIAGGLKIFSNNLTPSALSNSYSYCDIAGTNYVGGITGYYTFNVVHIEVNNAPYRLENCFQFGSISGTSYVGGIVGECNVYFTEAYGDEVKALITNCSAIADITSTGTNTGGVVGHMCSDYNGSIIGQSKAFVIKVCDSYYNGVLEGGSEVGGIVGYSEGCYIDRCYANATISGTSNVGGIVGKSSWFYYQNSGLTEPYTKSVIKNCMAVNSRVSGASNVGRIYGSDPTSSTIVGANGTTEDNRALTNTELVLSGVTQTVTADAQNGASNGEAYFKYMGSYVAHGWNFNNDWSILDTESFPYKKWQAAPPTITSNLVSGDQTISGKSINGGKVYVKIGDNDPLEAVCLGTDWSLSCPQLKSGQEVGMYVVADGKENSYRTKSLVGFPGSGTEADPWRVYDAYDLQGVYKPGYYKQMNDINLSSWINANSSSKGWLPVGFSGNEAIVYDGDNHKITNLWVNTTENYNGLFSSFSIGTIKNLTVEAGLKGVKGANYTGILIGQLIQGSIENVNVKGNVTGKNRTGGIVGSVTIATLSKLTYTGHVTGTSSVGGIAGLGLTLSECKATDIVVTSSGNDTGGLAGIAAQVSLSEVNGTITCSGNSSEPYVGGLLGSLQGSTVTKCFADVTVTCSSPQASVGGLIGMVANYNSEVSNCSSAGTVTSTGEGSMTGGLVGDADGFIRNCYSTADVTGTDYTAGLVGYNYGTVDKCYASGNVSSVYHAAGLVGYNDYTRAMVTNCVAINKKVNVSDQSGWSIRVIGGYKNGAPDPDESNFGWEGMQVSVNDVPKSVQDNLLDGQSLTTAQTKSQDTYESLGWDFENVWAMGTDYPQLQWQTVATNATGDVDGDGSIDVADIVMIIDVIAGLRTDQATVAAADVDGDGTVDVADIVACIDLIAQQVTGSPALTRRTSRADVSDYIAAAIQGDKVDLSLNNQNQYTAFQMTVTMPEGLVLKGATMDKSRGEDHQLAVRHLNDQEYLLMGFSMDKDIIFGNSGRLLTLTTEGAANGEIHFGHVLFAMSDAKSVRLDDASVQSSATGIRNVEPGIADVEVFDLQGRKVNGNAKSGLYIVNGKKVMVK